MARIQTRRPAATPPRQRIRDPLQHCGHAARQPIEGVLVTQSVADAAALRSRIGSVWPGLIRPDATVRATRGQFNDVLIVDDASVFRFPRTAAATESLRTEVALLRALQGRVPLPVPSPEHVRLGAMTPGGSIAGYRLLPGEPLTRETVARRTPSEIEDIAGQIAGLLLNLHTISATELPALPTADAPSDWADLFAAFDAELFPHMRPDARSAVAASFAAFLEGAGDSEFLPVLRHGDLGGENIRYDPSTNRVTGIIDFGSAALGDPAVDLSALSWYGDTFVDALLKRHPALAAPGLRSRAVFYQSTHALQQALWAIRVGDVGEFEDGIRAYR